LVCAGLLAFVLFNLAVPEAIGGFWPARNLMTPETGVGNGRILWWLFVQCAAVVVGFQALVAAPLTYLSLRRRTGVVRNRLLTALLLLTLTNLLLMTWIALST
jgi:hypothetical protein